MTQEDTELGGPDFTQGVKISTVPGGAMLLGHARGEAMILIRRGDEMGAELARNRRRKHECGSR